jgi:hypothetical protein
MCWMQHKQTNKQTHHAPAVAQAHMPWRPCEQTQCLGLSPRPAPGFEHCTHNQTPGGGRLLPIPKHCMWKPISQPPHTSMVAPRPRLQTSMSMVDRTPPMAIILFGYVGWWLLRSTNCHGGGSDIKHICFHQLVHFPLVQNDWLGLALRSS